MSEELVKALVHVRQSWVEMTEASSIFRSANVALGRDDILVIPKQHTGTSPTNISWIVSRMKG